MEISCVAFMLNEPWTIPAPIERPSRAFARFGNRVHGFASSDEMSLLLRSDLNAAERRARETLEHHPGEPLAVCVLGEVSLLRSQYAAARSILEPLVGSQPQLGSAWRALGIALARLGERAKAVAALTRGVDLAWRDTDSWYVLGDLLTFAEPRPGSRLHDAQELKRRADTILQGERWREFEPLLEQSVALAPDFVAARFRLATMLFTHGKCASALPHLEKLLESEPGNVLYRAMKALALMWSLEFDRAIAEFESFIATVGDRPGLWLEYARLVDAARHPRAAAAYKQAIRLLPSFVDAYFALAQARTARIDDEVIEWIDARLARPDLAPEERAKLYFVLGRAREQASDYARAFANFRACNDILFDAREFSIESSNAYVARASSVFTPEFFRRRAQFGCRGSGAIFIVGLPRSGSTLIEQILGNHPSVEALGEIDILPQVIGGLVPERPRQPGGLYPFNLRALDAAQFRRIGESYMAAARRLCTRATPFFTDKLPGNYAHIGLLRLALPDARIVDARRHPVGCCFSYFEHYFPSGHPLRLRLRDVGRHYVNYVELMALFDGLFPGNAHRVIYERLIANFEQEVRRLLEYLGLPFSDSCLRFHESARHAATISADQVRRPLYDTAVGHWRHYERWLDPLKQELGPVLELYPDVPKFFARLQARPALPLSLGGCTKPFACVNGLRQHPFSNTEIPRGF